MNFDLLTVTSIAACLSGLGACASAWATLRTVKEIRKQREASYMPDIGYSILRIESKQCSSIKICNIGLGVAKNVQIDVSIQFEHILAVLNQTLRAENICIFQRDDYLIFESMHNDNSISTYSLSIPCTLHSEYLFPGTDNSVDIILPDYLLELLKLIMQKAFVHENKAVKELLDGIMIKVSANYLDIGGKYYDTKFFYHLYDASFDLQDNTYSLRFK
jgi:hypothetical protein